MFTGTVKVKLSSPYKWEDKEITVVELDFGKVTGALINQCERDTFQGGNISGLNRPTSSEYCARLASAISGVPFRAIEKFPFYDFEKVWQTVSQFIRHENPQKFYDEFTADDEKPGFTAPAEKPDTTTTKPADTAAEKPDTAKTK